MKLEVGSVCDRGLSTKRPVNEDRALVRVDHGLFVVCDGVGGHNSGEVASQMAVDTIEEALENAAPTDATRDVADLLGRAVQYANRDIYETAASRPEFDGMATTIAMLYLDERAGRAIIGHAGDSRVYRFDGDTLHRETYDHTDLDDAIRAGVMSPEEAVARGKQNTINRALGVEDEVQAEFKTIDLSDSDSFLLCSDGVTRHIADNELESLLGNGLNPNAVCEEIRSRCYSRGAEDNLTAIVVKRGDASPRATPKGRFEFAVDAPGKAATSTSRSPSGIGLPLGAMLLLVTAIAAFVAGMTSETWLPRSLRRTSPPDPAVTAREAFERGDIATARATFAQLATKEPGRADYQYWIGRIALREGDDELAALHLERAINIDPSMRDVYPHLAAAYTMSGRPELATEALQRYAGNTNKNEASKTP